MTQAEIDKLKAAKAKHPTAGRTVLARAAGVSEGIAKLFLQGRAKPSGVKMVKVVSGGSVVKGINVKAFLHKMDYPAQIKTAIKEHCNDSFLPETEFRMLAGLSTSAFSIGKNGGAFADNMFKQDNIVYWSSSKNVALAKEKRGMK